MSTETAQRRRVRIVGSGSQNAGRDDLIDFVARDLDTTKNDASQIIDSVTRAICELSIKHSVLRVPNLGNFRVLDTPERAGCNPRTGEPVPVPAGRRISFRAAGPLKVAINKAPRRG